MEAAIRTAHFLITGGNCGNLDGRGRARPRRHQGGPRRRSTGLKIGVAVVSGLGNARSCSTRSRPGRSDLHFIEVMTCPGGCIAGGGQPLAVDPDAVRARMQALYKIDREETCRTSHSNESVQRLYQEFLGEPLGKGATSCCTRTTFVASLRYDRGFCGVRSACRGGRVPPRPTALLPSRVWQPAASLQPSADHSVYRKRNRHERPIHHHDQGTLPHVLYVRAGVSGQGDPDHRRPGRSDRRAVHRVRQLRARSAPSTPSRSRRLDRPGRGACWLPAAKVAACLAPSFPAEFVEVDYRRLLGRIRHLGSTLCTRWPSAPTWSPRQYRKLAGGQSTAAV